MSLAQALFFPTPAVAKSATIGPARQCALVQLPFSEPIRRAVGVHRLYADPTEARISTLPSIKTGGGPQPLRRIANARS